MLLANESTYRKLSTFKSVEELNEAIKTHKQAHALSPTERAVLDVISRYACKYPGVCYLSKNKIGEAVGKVRRTVIRVCQRLEALGIIKQYETKRDGGDRRQSTNVIVVQADVLPKREDINDIVGNSDNNSIVRNVHEQTGPWGLTYGINPVAHNGHYADLKSKVTPEMTHQETPSNKLNNINYINTYSDEPKPFYVRFKAFISQTIGEGNQRLISRLYGVYKAHSTPLLRRHTFDKQDVEQAGWQALKAAVMATKSKNIRNIAGYYNGVLDRMLDRLYFETMDELGGLPTSIPADMPGAMPDGFPA